MATMQAAVVEASGEPSPLRGMVVAVPGAGEILVIPGPQGSALVARGAEVTPVQRDECAGVPLPCLDYGRSECYVAVGIDDGPLDTAGDPARVVVEFPS